MKKDFHPFYERFAEKIGIKIIGKAIFSLLAGLLFFIPYYMVEYKSALHDWSWLLGILISCGLLFLYYATATLRNLFPRWDQHFGEEASEIYLEPLRTILSDRRLLLAGVLFGFLNMLMGFCFGITVTETISRVLLYFGFFLAGFACGLPAYGIYGVIVTISAITDGKRFHIDFSSPDRCGGLGFMGDALVKFSSLTLIEGLLIATYIYNARWGNTENGWVQLIMWFWIAFPFILSLLILIAPAVEINNMLDSYKHKQERNLLKNCQELREKSEGTELTCDQRSLLRAEYAYLIQQREEIHKMRTWPFTIASTTSFLGAFVSNIVFAKSLVEKFIR